MLILHKMATSPYLFSYSLSLSTPISLSLLKPPLPLHSPLKRLLSISKLQPETQATSFGALYSKRNGVSTSTAVATTESAAVAQNDRADETQEEETQKIMLPTNESSEKLLRIRHTVNCIFFSPFVVICWWVFE